MTYIVKLILFFFDYFTEKKINKVLLKILNNRIVTIVDVGSHKGEYILKCLNKFNVKKIYGFEANPIIYNNLVKNFKNNNRVVLNNFGLGDKNFKINFFRNIESSSSSFNQLNENSKYYKKKYFFLNFFKSKVIKKIKVNVIKLKDFILKNKIKDIDLLKIDTEGYEFRVLKGTGSKINIIKLIHLEHHFDDMIVKKYTLSDIHNYLKKMGFKKIFKVKMKFRKSFEYIYQNQIYK